MKKSEMSFLFPVMALNLHPLKMGCQYATLSLSAK